MKLNLYSIFDRKMGVYLAPFPSRGDVDATRSLVSGLSHPDVKNTPLGQHPEDFDLVKIGVFNDETGEIGRLGPEIVIGRVADLASTVAS